MSLQHKLAPFKRRLAAKAIDAALAFGGVMVASILIDVIGLSPGWMLIPCLAAIAYLLLGDGMNGQSVGKRLCGLQVVDYKHGYPCKFWQSALRNIAGFGWLRLFQLADESDAIEAGTFTGQVVVDIRPTPPQPSATEPSGALGEMPPRSAKIDFEGIGDLVRKKK